MLKQHKSKALAAAHKAVLGLAEAGIMSGKTMRMFDETCLTPVAQMTADHNREVVRRGSGSQTAFESHQPDHGLGE